MIGILILCYLPLNLFYHYRLSPNIRISRDEFKHMFCGDNFVKELWMWASWVNFVFCQLKGCDYYTDLLRSLDRRWPITLFAARLWLIGTVIGWFWNYDRTSTVQLAFLLLLLITQTVMAFHHIENFQLLYFFTVMVVPVFIIICLTTWLGNFFSTMFPWCKRRNVRPERDHSLMNLPNFENQPPIAIQLHNNQGVVIQRMTTNQALGNILVKWKKQFTLRKKEKTECCWVWLEEFMIGENIIELKCNSAHIFHPIWLEGWAGRNTHCPLWRKDLVEMVQNNPDQSIERESENNSRQSLIIA